MPPFFGYHMPNYTFPDTPPEQLFDRTVALAQAAESAGFDLVTVMDHFYQIAVVAPEEEPMLEGYAALAALAMRTNRVMLGTMVTGVTYRNPAMLAKTVTSLDIISKGRAVLGIGAAWNEDEHRGYGYEFPPIKERMDRLEEALQICTSMFREERPSFEGTYYTIDGALNRPRPIRPSGPPILIGGGGEQRTLRMVARYADIANYNGSPEELQHKTDVLEGYCEEIGRDPAEITRTTFAPAVLVENERDGEAVIARIPEARRRGLFAAMPAQAAERLRPLVDMGFGLVFRNVLLRTPESVALAGELRKLLS